MADISSKVSLDAKGYIDAVTDLTEALQKFTTAATNADTAAGKFANIPKLAAPATDIGKAITDYLNKQKDIAKTLSLEYTSMNTRLGSMQEILNKQLRAIESITTAERTRASVQKEQIANAEKMTGSKVSSAAQSNVARQIEKTILEEKAAAESLRRISGVRPLSVKPSTHLDEKEKAEYLKQEKQAQEHLYTMRREYLAKYYLSVRQTANDIAKVLMKQPGMTEENAIKQGVAAAKVMTGTMPGEQKASEQEIRKVYDLIRQEPELAQKFNQHRMIGVSVEKQMTSEYEKQNKALERINASSEQGISKRRYDKTMEGLKSTMSLKDDEFMDRFRGMRLEGIKAPASADESEITQISSIQETAARHFEVAKRDVYSKYALSAEKTRRAIAKAYSEDTTLSPEDATEQAKRALGLMTQMPKTPQEVAGMSSEDKARYEEQQKRNEQELQELLKNRLAVYEAINKHRMVALSLEQKLTAEAAAQDKESSKSYNRMTAQRMESTRKIRAAALEESDQLGWLQSTFQKAHGREIKGFGLVDVTRAGQNLLETYTKTPIDFAKQFKDLASSDEVKQFQNVIESVQKGNARLIAQYPELASAATSYNRAIKYGEIESARFVAHWDNFFRLVLARGVTLVFYSISNAIRQATIDAGELWRSIAEVQTISGDAKLSIDDWSLSVLNLSNAYHIAQQDIVEAIYEITSNQVAAGQSAVTFAGTSAGLAKATKSSLTEAVNALSSVVNSYNINISNAEILSAQLFKTVELGRVRLADMANTMGRVTSMTALLGIKFEEVQALIDLITIGGVKFERSSTYIVNIVNSLLKPSEKMQGFFRSIGVETGQAAIALYGFGGLLQRLMEYTHGEAGELAELAKNLRAITGFAAVTQNIDEYERLVAETKVAMKSYLEAQEYIYKGPGERLLEITTKAKNVFVSGAQEMLSAVLVFDDYLKNAKGSVVSDATRAMGVNGIADLSAFLPSAAVFTATALLGKSAAALGNDPEVSKMWTKGGIKLGGILAAGIAVGTIAHLKSQKVFREAGIDYEEYIKNSKIAMEKRYHEENARIDEIERKRIEKSTKETHDLGIILAERKNLWMQFYKEITDPLQITINTAKELGSVFDNIIKRQQDLFVGYAQGPVDELVRKVAVSRDIFGRVDQYGSENTLEMSQRFMQYAQSTLSDLDKQIMDIEKNYGNTPEAPYYAILQAQRSELMFMMDTMIQRYAQEISDGQMQGVVDPYAAMFQVKDIEKEWQDYFVDFKEMSDKVDQHLKDGIGKLEAIRAELAAELTPRQKALFERDVVTQPLFQSYLGAQYDLNTYKEDQAIEAEKVKKAREGIGAGLAAEFMMPGQAFTQLYAASKILADRGVEGMSTLFTQAQSIEKQFRAFEGIIPPDKQEEFDKQLKDFVASFSTANKELHTRLKDIADTSSLKFWKTTERESAQTILATVDAELLKRFDQSGLPPILRPTALANGGSVGGPRGTDTVPAWLTPGEFVVNRNSAQKFAPLLEHINARGYADGGSVSNEFDIYSTLLLEKLRNKKQYGERSGNAIFNAQKAQLTAWGETLLAEKSPEAIREVEARRARKALTEEYNYDPLYGLVQPVPDRVLSNVRKRKNTWEGKRSKDRTEEMLFEQSQRSLVRDRHISESIARAKQRQSGLKTGRFTEQLGYERLDPTSKEYADLLAQVKHQEWLQSPIGKQNALMELASKGQQRFDFRGFNKERFTASGESMTRTGLVQEQGLAWKPGGPNVFDEIYGEGSLGGDMLRGFGTGAALTALIGGSILAAPALPAILPKLGTALPFLARHGKSLMQMKNLRTLGFWGAGIGGQEAYNYYLDPKREAGLAGFLGRLPEEVMTMLMFRMLLGGGKKMFSAKPKPEDMLSPQMANGGWVTQPRGRFEFGGSVKGQTVNNYSTTANITLQTSGNEAIDARRIMDNINRESYRGTRRLN